jgi:hypothetical protein
LESGTASREKGEIWKLPDGPIKEMGRTEGATAVVEAGRIVEYRRRNSQERRGGLNTCTLQTKMDMTEGFHSENRRAMKGSIAERLDNER